MMGNEARERSKMVWSLFFSSVCLKKNVSELTLYVPIIAILDIWKTTLFMKANPSCTTDSSMYGP